MKKLFSILIALALLAGVVSPAFAVTTCTSGGSGLGTLRTVTLYNNASSPATTSIAVTTIIPGKVKILGYEAAAFGASAAMVDIQDSIADTVAYTIAEVEAYTTLPASKWFPMGLDISRGITIFQGGYSSVTIYYVQDVG